ncbi:SURF1 family protein [Roseibium hamelinense]|nr:SURF1 family protein [Roseibium hamelinense]
MAAAAALVVLLNLGFWQLDRLAWKEALIEKVREDVTKPPVPLPDHSQWTSAAPEQWDYTHVRVTGRFLPGAAFYYTALNDATGHYDGPGYLVYAPFETLNGMVVLVNRGFIPQGLADGVAADATVPPDGQRALTGLLRVSEQPNWTTPSASTETMIWFARDTNAMGNALGIEADKLAPYSVDLDQVHTPNTGLPQAGETIVRFKNDHLGYALTWFGLAATLVGVFLAYAASVVWPRPESNPGK